MTINPDFTATSQTCRRGHSRTPENTRTTAAGKVHCLTCIAELYPDGKKHCGNCGELLPTSDFVMQTDPRGSTFLGTRCRLCNRKAARKWELENPLLRKQASRKGWLDRNYDLTPAQYDELLAAQKGRCAICGALEARGRNNVMQVDHRPGTKSVRGLLCNHCNAGLPRFKDDPQRLRAAARYLRSWGANEDLHKVQADEAARSVLPQQGQSRRPQGFL